MSLSKDDLEDFIDYSSSIIQSTMTNAIEYSIDADYLTGYSDIVNSMIYMPMISNKVQNSIQDIYETFADTMIIINTESIRSGNKKNISFTTANVNIRIAPLSVTNSIPSLSSKDHVMKLISSNFTRRKLDLVMPSTNIPLMLSVTRGSLYSNKWKITTNSTDNEKVQFSLSSNPLRMNINCASASDMKVLIVLQNNEPQDYSRIMPLNTSIITHCTKGIIEERREICYYPDDNTFEIVIKCIGNNDTFVTNCPSRSREPTCYLSSPFAESCILLDYSSNQVSCLCDLCSSYSRRLVAGSMAVSYQAVSVTKYMFENYVSVMMSSSTLQPQDFLSTLIISISFAVMWISIIVLVTMQAIYKSQLNSKKEKSLSFSVNPDQELSAPSLEKILKDYVISYLPSIYKEEKRYELIAKQLLIHHQYLRLLSNAKNSLDSKSKWVDAFQLLTIVSANMFILALLFDIRYPSNDHSCETYGSEVLCLRRKTIFNSYCEWNFSSSPPCTFAKPEFDVVAVIILAWLQLITSVPIKTLINFLFERIIYAATKKTIEQQLEDNQVCFVISLLYYYN